MSLPAACLVDTNVAIVANEKSPQADDALVEKCINALLEITRRGVVVLDDRGLIFEEYRQSLSLSGQPGTGDAFVKWLSQNQWNPELCERRGITPRNDERMFEEFPFSTALRDFDRSDRKFVAVANACSPKRPILQAVDFKWWGWKEALADEGIEVVFLDEAAAENGFRHHIDA